MVRLGHALYFQPQSNRTFLANKSMRRPRIEQYSDETIVYGKHTRHHWSSLWNTLKGRVVHLPRLEVSNFAFLILLN